MKTVVRSRIGPPMRLNPPELWRFVMRKGWFVPEIERPRLPFAIHSKISLHLRKLQMT